jgi:uncharacterized protein YndB with AHSA1/START domain
VSVTGRSEVGSATREWSRRLAARLWRQYVFCDEWAVAAPREAVFEALADPRSYPLWWRPVHLDVDAEVPIRVGSESRQHFKGRLPYRLRTRSRIVTLEPPALIEAAVDGDLRGHGTWTLRERPGGTWSASTGSCLPTGACCAC